MSFSLNVNLETVIVAGLVPDQNDETDRRPQCTRASPSNVCLASGLSRIFQKNLENPVMVPIDLQNQPEPNVVGGFIVVVKTSQSLLLLQGMIPLRMVLFEP